MAVIVEGARSQNEGHETFGRAPARSKENFGPRWVARSGDRATTRVAGGTVREWTCFCRSVVDGVTLRAAMFGPCRRLRYSHFRIGMVPATNFGRPSCGIWYTVRWWTVSIR